MKDIKLSGKQTLYFFGGPYSNLQATTELKNILESKRVLPEHIFCTGDTLAYCSNPNETLSILKSWGITSIQGNVEEQIINDQDSCGCNFEEGSECDLLSDNWYNFIRESISSESLSYIKTFPIQLRIETEGDNIRVIHGGVENISKFLYEQSPIESFSEEINLLDDNTSIIVSGHSGIPFGKRLDEKLWLNTGVIGMPPNDGTRKGWYLELVINNGVSAHFKSFSYDSEQTSKHMLDNNLPKQYASSLLTGYWPNQDTIPKEQRNDQGREILDFSIF